MLPKNRKPTHPGEILWKDFMLPNGLTQTELAKHLKWTHAKVNELVNQKRGITPVSALALADAFGTTPELWITLQNNFDLWNAAQTHVKFPKIKKVA